MLAKTFAGLEEVLKQELLDLGAEDIQLVKRGVKFSGDKKLLYKANFCLRTASRILMIIGEYKVNNANDLYEVVKEINWPGYFDLKQTFSVSSTVNSEAFNSSMFVSLKAKDAIVDRFRNEFGKRPSVNTEKPDIRVHVHASADEVSISLDSSGDSLHKRGYKKGQNEAPINEVLAAGLLLLAGWKGQTNFYDPMCGSGTLPIEAALIANNIPPGYFRESYAFETWKDFDEEMYDDIYNEDYEKDFDYKIFASDISSVNIKISATNARNAGLKKYIEFKVSDFKHLEPETKEGLIMINPPYGKRLELRDISVLYSMIGERMKHHFKGFNAWIFSSSEDGFNNIGLRYSERYKLLNGSLECSYRKYELFDGKMKSFKSGPRNDNRGYGGRDRNQRRGDGQNGGRRDGFSRGGDGYRSGGNRPSGSGGYSGRTQNRRDDR